MHPYSWWSYVYSVSLRPGPPCSWTKYRRNFSRVSLISLHFNTYGSAWLDIDWVLATWNRSKMVKGHQRSFTVIAIYVQLGMHTESMEKMRLMSVTLVTVYRGQICTMCWARTFPDQYATHCTDKMKVMHVKSTPTPFLTLPTQPPTPLYLSTSTSWCLLAKSQPINFKRPNDWHLKISSKRQAVSMLLIMYVTCLPV